MADEEEQLLEEQLFGRSKKRVKRAEQSVGAAGADGEEDTGLGWVADDQLFSIDAPTAWTERPESEDDEFETVQDDEPSIDFHFDESSSSSGPAAPHSTPIWVDAADDSVSVSPMSDKRLRKIHRGQARYKEGGSVSGSVLQQQLKEQFERLHPKPSWSTQRAGNLHSPLTELLSSTSSFLSASSSSGPLPPHSLDIQRLENANRQNPSTGRNQAVGVTAGVVDVSWHPSRQNSVLAISGGDRRVRLFNIDGHINAPLVTLHVPSLPLTNASFHPSGSSLLMTGSRPYYYVFDLASQKCLRSPRNLFGSVASPTSPQSLYKHAFSPDGSLLAVGGRGGAVTVVEWQKGGLSGAVVAELRSGRGGGVGGIIWEEGGKELSVLGGRDGTEVEVWDVAERKIVRRWADSRAYGGQIIKRSRDYKYTAIGSTTGIVNLYASDTIISGETLSNPTLGTVEAQPLKSLEHLTTSIDSVCFHPSNELFASASNAKKDALRLYHLPSGTAFSNWPTSTTPLGRISNVGFSSNGQYLSVGNTKGSVLLWSLKHFSST